MNVMTVLGPLEKNKLGHCQCHEHLFIKEGKSKEINPALCLDDYEATLKELNNYKKSGGDSIVDAQPLGCGRMTENLIKSSKQSNLNIIASTGFHKLKFYPEQHWIFDIDLDDFQNVLKKEIENGMYLNTEDHYPNKQVSSKAGIIKTAYSEENTDQIIKYEKLLAAAAEVAKESNTTIMCHTDKGNGALKVVDILTKKGVNPKSIIICHLDRKANNFDFHYQVANRGVFLDYDTIGRFKYHSDEDEITLIKRMIKQGFENNILLSLDTTNERMKSYGGNIGLDYLIKKFIPLLRKHKISDKIIDKMTKDNPASALTN